MTMFFGMSPPFLPLPVFLSPSLVFFSLLLLFFFYFLFFVFVLVDARYRTLLKKLIHESRLVMTMFWYVPSTSFLLSSAIPLFQLFSFLFSLMVLIHELKLHGHVCWYTSTPRSSFFSFTCFLLVFCFLYIFSFILYYIILYFILFYSFILYFDFILIYCRIYGNYQSHCSVASSNPLECRGNRNVHDAHCSRVAVSINQCLDWDRTFWYPLPSFLLPPPPPLLLLLPPPPPSSPLLPPSFPLLSPCPFFPPLPLCSLRSLSHTSPFYSFDGC